MEFVPCHAHSPLDDPVSKAIIAQVNGQAVVLKNLRPSCHVTQAFRNLRRTRRFFCHI